MSVCEECDGEGYITIGNSRWAPDGAEDVICPECGDAEPEYDEDYKFDRD